MLSKVRLGLVEDWRECWKWATMQLSGLVLLVSLVAQVMPVLDPHIAVLLPEPLRDPATGVYAMLILLVRVMEVKRDG